jgi:hypothetical protein
MRGQTEEKDLHTFYPRLFLTCFSCMSSCMCGYLAETDLQAAAVNFGF